MKKLFITSIVLLIFVSINGLAITCPNTVQFGENHLHNFTCYTGSYSELNDREYHDALVFTVASKKNMNRSFLVIRNSKNSPQCSVSSSSLTTVTTGDNRLDMNKVIQYCRSHGVQNVNYIVLPYGFDKTGINRYNSFYYQACFYKNGDTWKQGRLHNASLFGSCPLLKD